MKALFHFDIYCRYNVNKREIYQLVFCMSRHRYADVCVYQCFGSIIRKFIICERRVGKPKNRFIITSKAKKCPIEHGCNYSALHSRNLNSLPRRCETRDAKRVLSSVEVYS